jgi:hypothetical protein
MADIEKTIAAASTITANARLAAMMAALLENLNGSLLFSKTNLLSMSLMLSLLGLTLPQQKAHSFIL